MMDSYYSDLKKDVGVEPDQNSDGDDDQLEGILSTLKPNTTPGNFRDYLNKKDNCNKTQAWRNTSRQMHRKDAWSTM
mgnify:CR=1 FL=1|jgi:hypothetical protein